MVLLSGVEPPTDYESVAQLFGSYAIKPLLMPGFVHDKGHYHSLTGRRMDEELGAKIEAMFVELHAHSYDGKHDKVLNRATWRALTPAAGRGRALGLPRNYAESKLGSQTFVLNGGK